MEDTHSWKGLGRRLFDVYIQVIKGKLLFLVSQASVFDVLTHLRLCHVQGERVVQDLNIQKEAGGSKRALIKTFETNVSNTIMDIHFLWAGKGTCCIPYQGTYGPLVSAIHVYEGNDIFLTVTFSLLVK